ncbi:MAG TPA: hypothetical protein PLH67_03350 [Lentisphaeria bacterium]|nr:hypothetical protein [Lentisphaeria bacterium]
MLKHHGFGLLCKISVDGWTPRKDIYYSDIIYSIDLIAARKSQGMENIVFDMDKIRIMAASARSVEGSAAMPPPQTKVWG